MTGFACDNKSLEIFNSYSTVELSTESFNTFQVNGLVRLCCQRVSESHHFYQ